jgi:creatinine amidohydrolase
MKTLFLEEMTSPEIKKAIADGYKTIIVAAGSIEQHGKHLPIGTDTMAGTTCALEIAEGLGYTLVAPTIRPGCSDHHMPFSGTITIPVDLLKDLARAYCRSLVQHGFERIVLLAMHGGNIEPLAEVAKELSEELNCKIVSPLILGVPETEAAIQPLLEKYGLTAEQGGIHAGFIETSEMLGSPYRHLVKMEHAEPGFIGNPFQAIEKVKVDGHWKISDLSVIGVLGDPRKASVEAGEELSQIATPVYVKIVAQSLGDL